MRALLTHLLKGHQPAVDLCMAVFDWANAYDHLVDGDPTDKSPEDTLHDAIWLMAVAVPSNAFYQAFQTELTASLANGLCSWRASNELAKSGDIPDMLLAHVLRWNLIEFFLHCARLVGGREWADSQAPGFWRGMTKDHSFGQFAAEHRTGAA